MHGVVCAQHWDRKHVAFHCFVSSCPIFVPRKTRVRVADYDLGDAGGCSGDVLLGGGARSGHLKDRGAKPSY
jgi:hypothetical protein